MARMEYRRGAYRILVRRPDGRRPRGKPKRRWEHNIKVNIQEVELGDGLDGTGLGWGQVGCACKCGNEPSGSIGCG